MALVLYLRSYLHTSVTPSKNIRLVVQIIAGGSVPELEGTVKSVLWLIESGTLPAQAEIIDSGMDGETRAVASALCKDNGISIRRLPDG
jgi:hypothetical protein